MPGPLTDKQKLKCVRAFQDIQGKLQRSTIHF